MRTDAEMVELCSRVGKLLDGENLLDAASVCALSATWAIAQAYDDPNLRWEAMAKIQEFMNEQLQRMKTH